MALLFKAIDAATEAESDEHVQRLAAVLRDGLTAVIEVPEARALIEAVSQLRPWDVRVPHYLTQLPPPLEGQDGPAPHHADSVIAKSLGSPFEPVRSALRRLEDHGAVETVGDLWDGGEGWNISPRGKRVLHYLAAVAEEAPPNS